MKDFLAEFYEETMRTLSTGLMILIIVFIHNPIVIAVDNLVQRPLKTLFSVVIASAAVFQGWSAYLSLQAQGLVPVLF